MAEPSLTSTWWDRNRAKTLPSTGLTKLLTAYEKTTQSFEQEAAKNPVSPATEPAFMAAKKQLAEVEKGLRTAVGKCNKTLHKETLANLGKLEQQALPKERKRLDDVYKAWNVKRTGAIDKIATEQARVEGELSRLMSTAEKDWRQAGTESAKVNSAVTDVMSAAGRSDQAAAADALKRATGSHVAVAKILDGIDVSLANATKLSMPRWPAGLLPDGDKRERAGDRFENAMSPVHKLADLVATMRKDLQSALDDAAASAKGELAVQKRVESELRRLLDRMDKAAQQINSLVRDGSAHTGNFWGSIDNHNKATTDAERQDQYRMAKAAQASSKQELAGAKAALDVVIADMTRTLKAQPKGAVTTTAEPLASLLADIRSRNAHLLELKADTAKYGAQWVKNTAEFDKL